MVYVGGGKGSVGMKEVVVVDDEDEGGNGGGEGTWYVVQSHDV